jgi:hypothetical protein
MRRRPRTNLFALLSGLTVLVSILTPGTATAATAPGSSPANPIIVPFHESTPGTYVATLATSGSTQARPKTAATPEWCSFTPETPYQVNGSGVGSWIDGALNISCSPNSYQQVVFYGCIRHAPSQTGYPNGTWQPDGDSCRSYQGGPSTWAYLPLAHNCPGSNPWWYHSWGDVDVLYQGVWSLIGPAQSPAIFAFC